MSLKTYSIILKKCYSILYLCFYYNCIQHLFYNLKNLFFLIFNLLILFSCNKDNSESNGMLLDGTTCSLGLNNTYNCSMIKNGLAREFIVYVPESYSSQNLPVPLLFSLHGFTSYAEWNIQYTGFQSLADKNGFIVIYPQGSLWKTIPSEKTGFSSEGNTHWNVGWTTELGERSSSDDIGFIDDLIEWSSDNYNVNTNRVYSTGMSNGGFMSYHLACNLGSKIAAIASVTGSMSPKTFSECTPDHPTPVMQIHGLDDYVVPYLGYKGLCEPMDDVINFWVNYNSCNSLPESQIITDLNGDEYGGVHKIYENGENNVSVEFYLLDEMGHEWPRVNAPGDYGSYDIDAPSLIWKFLSKYDINGLIN